MSLTYLHARRQNTIMNKIHNAGKMNKEQTRRQNTNITIHHAEKMNKEQTRKQNTNLSASLLLPILQVPQVRPPRTSPFPQHLPVAVHPDCDRGLVRVPPQFWPPLWTQMWSHHLPLHPHYEFSRYHLLL